MKISRNLCAFLVLGSFLGWWGLEGVQAQPLGIMGQKAEAQSAVQCLGRVGGRFVFGQVSESPKDKFMLDTATGRLWRVSESGEMGLYLSPVPYRTHGKTYSPTPDEGPGPNAK